MPEAALGAIQRLLEACVREALAALAVEMRRIASGNIEGALDVGRESVKLPEQCEELARKIDAFEEGLRHG